MIGSNAEKNMEASKNSDLIYKANKIEPIHNISKEKLELGAKAKNWVFAVCCRRDMVQKVVVLPIYIPPNMIEQILHISGRP